MIQFSESMGRGADVNKRYEAGFQLPRDTEVAFHLCKRIVQATIEALHASAIAIL
ncbi:MAG: hypothetical protein ACKPJF_27400 [Dolichospermum sp.]